MTFSPKKVEFEKEKEIKKKNKEILLF